MASPIRWTLAIPTEVRCEYAGIPQGAYYTDLEQAIRVCQDFPPAFEMATGYLPETSYAVPVTAYEGVAALGGDLVFPTEHQPMIRNQGYVLDNLALDIAAVPDPYMNKRFRQHVNWLRALECRFPNQVVRGGLAGQEGPITTAGLLRGQQFFLDCLDNPPRAHCLLNLCTEMYIHWAQADRTVCGSQATIAGIADDYAGLLNPSLWSEFVLPYYQRICAALGPQGLALHSELLRRQHLPLLHKLPLVSLNFGENQYLQPEDVAVELPDVPFGWHILAVAEMLQGTPESVQQRFKELANRGVRHVLVELTVGTPPGNVRAFVEVGQELAG
ncbi:MAG: uroporphyrinogen decarboxylase family protein [Anaerolineae bacterium]